MDIVKILAGVVAIFNAIFARKEKAENINTGQDQVKLAEKTKVLENVQIAKNIDNGIDTNGALAKFVRERSKGKSDS